MQLTMQEMADVIELALLGCRTRRDKLFVEEIVQKINAAQQGQAHGMNGEAKNALLLGDLEPHR